MFPQPYQSFVARLPTGLKRVAFHAIKFTIRRHLQKSMRSSNILSELYVKYVMFDLTQRPKVQFVLLKLQG